MSGTNYILQFGETLVSPQVQTDSEYEADSSRTGGWPAPEVVPQDFLNKVHIQALAVASGISQFVADNQEEDVHDTLSPTDYEALFIAALQNTPFITQSQFDNTTKAATTAFVQRALGSFSGASSYSVNTVLPITDVGRVINAGSSGLTFTLPLTSSVLQDGGKMLIRGNGYGAIVQRQGGTDVIQDGSAGPLSYITVAANDVVELTKIGAAWYVTGGNEQLNTSSQFAQSRASNGYIKLPGGLILQWGSGTFPNTSNTASDQSVTFPLPFVSAVLQVFACSNGVGVRTSSGGVGGLSICAAESITLTGCSIHGDTNGSTFIFNNSSGFRWWAIGV